MYEKVVHEVRNEIVGVVVFADGMILWQWGSISEHVGRLHHPSTATATAFPDARKTC